MEQQRCNQIPFIDRLEHVHRVQHPRFVEARKLFHQRLDGRGVGHVEAYVGRGDRARVDAPSERLQILAPGQHRGEDPQARDDQARVTQTLPGQAKPPRLDEHEEQERPQGFREPVGRHVDEQFRAELQVGRQRQKEHFARRLVERVPKRRIDDSRGRWRPERAVQQDDHPGDPEARRQHEQREQQTERAVNPAGQPHLHDEADDRQVKGHLRKESGDGIGRRGAVDGLDGHVELLIDDGSAKGREGDHQRDHLQVA